MIMIIPCGKTPLLKKGTDLQEVFGDVKNIDSDSRPEIFNRHELYEETVQVDVDLGFDVDGCVGDNPKGRWNPNIYLTILNHLLWLPIFNPIQYGGGGGQKGPLPVFTL